MSLNHPTPNEKIAQVAWDAARGKVPGTRLEPGRCLQVVRVIIEWALFSGKWALYDKYLLAGTSTRPGTPAERLAAAKLSPWAADFEASMKALQLQVAWKDRKPGDIWFNHTRARPFGHVGIFVDVNTIVENIDPAARPGSVHAGNNLCLTPVSPTSHTLIARLEP